MLTGTYLRSLDEKLRVAVPKGLREAGEPTGDDALYVTPGTDGCVAVYTPAALAVVAKRLDEAAPHGAAGRTFARLFYAQAQRVECDGQGRIRLPADLAAGAELAGEIVILGVQDHLELWNAERWRRYLSEQRPRYDELAEAAFQPSPAS
jgi:MraZ protein